MSKTKSYTGIDLFRFVAAFLVIAIHTSPLIRYSEIGDFILTRIIARVAVPFFFMTSGFFLITRYTYDSKKLIAFVKKSAILYGVAIAIYIPFNIYNGYFAMDNLYQNILKDIIFNGTLYHLWYLPASIIGAILAWFLVKRFDYKKAFIITAVLYIIGLFGDSYYGFINDLPYLKNLYSIIFEVTDYTRNGIFFAPIFFVLGGIIANSSIRISLKNCLFGFAISFMLMFGEALLLHKNLIQRHDSMYLMLIPSMYFLFRALTFWRGRRIFLLRTSALISYIIHPMIIVVVRILARILNMQTLLVENNFVLFLLVSVFSTVFSIITTVIFYHIKSKSNEPFSINKDRSWIEINLNHLKHNVDQLKTAMPSGCELMAVVKAGAYGHGVFEVSTYMEKVGVKAFAVATIDEGIELRSYGIWGDILILGYTNPKRAKELHKFDLIQTVIDLNHAHLLNSQEIEIKVHIKIDTGMHRLGFDSNDVTGVLNVYNAKHLSVCGIYTHLCVSDSSASKDIDYTNTQIEKFYKLLDLITQYGEKLPPIHIQSSYGLLNYPELKCDYVRAGISLYGGQYSLNDRTKLQLDLRPVLSLKSQIVLIRKINRGESVGYGRSFVATRDSLIAVLPIGYADGLPRNLSCENGEAIINGHYVPIIGRICMDQLAIDVTDIQDVSFGDIVTLIGKDGDCELSVSKIAGNLDSIANELLCRMGKRLEIITKE